MTTKEAASNTIDCLGASKGGLGKSMLTMAIPDHRKRDRVFFEIDSSESVRANPFAPDVMPESLSGVRKQRATYLNRGGHAYVATSPELRANP
jgi:hypothetical protein